MRALITGIAGQDGIHLTKFLLAKGYEIYGVENGQRSERAQKFRSMFPEVSLLRGDLADLSSLQKIISESKPNEIYNLGAISFVGISFIQPELTANITGLGALRMLEAIRQSQRSEIRFYQASSSEMFGKVREVPQTELTPFHPRSPYGVAKAFAHHMTVNYREAYGLHASCGILFNHEGEHRGYEFVTRKISSAVARIALGKQQFITLGSLEPKRDWGYAGDYVEAMWSMLQQDHPDDYVIATGESHSVREFVELALQVAELPNDLEKFVKFDQNLSRPSEVDLLIGDSSKARSTLGWKPRKTFEDLVTLMVENDLRLES